LGLRWGVGVVPCARLIIGRYLANDTDSLYMIWALLAGKRPSDVAEELSVPKRRVQGIYIHFGGCYRHRELLLKLYAYLDTAGVEPVIEKGFHACRACGKVFNGDRVASVKHVLEGHRDIVHRVLRAWAREVVRAWR